MGRLKFKILTGSKSYIEQTLEEYQETKDAHSVMILGFSYDGTTYHVLVRYRDTI